jgi:hypothetical protein
METKTKRGPKIEPWGTPHLPFPNLKKILLCALVSQISIPTIPFVVQYLESKNHHRQKYFFHSVITAHNSPENVYGMSTIVELLQ